MSEFQNKKVLITGGFGFIGSHLVKRLLKEGAEVHIIERANTNRYRLLDDIDKIKTYEMDICDPLTTGSVIMKVNPDYAFHLASYGVDSTHKDYEKAASTNVLGSVNIMKALCETDCRKIINIGTCSEYGNSETSEDSIPAPVNIYGSTKAAATIILHQIAKENKIDIVTLRPFGVFGEGEASHKIFSYVIQNILSGNDVPLTQCEQYRDYCHVENIVDAMLLACEKSLVTNEIYNVASGESHPLYYYIDLIFELAGSKNKPLYGHIPYRNTELWNPKTDIGKIKSMLGWEVKLSLKEGILQTIEWYKSNISKFEL